jgi:hypothetical protein
MPLSWNEIKSRSFAFAKEWENESSEDAEAKSFWDGFFNIFGISRRRVASFEEPVKKLGDKRGFIDLFWKGVLVVEHKSSGKDLDRAYTQALDYFPGILERDLPKYVLVSDFVRFRLYDLEENQHREFQLKDLHKHVGLFGFIAGYQTHRIQDHDPVNIHAAERMGKLHDQMKEVGYEGHPLELYLVRLLFCLFADDTGIFERQQFRDYIEQRTGEDGADLAYHVSALFQVLNTPKNMRLKNLDEELAAFPYVNGKLFEEMLPVASFDRAMRQSLLDCCALDWSRISPAIFGSLFQSIMDKTARRNLGAHYTSEKNILKLIKPLFLDALWEEFEKVKGNRNRLFEFQKKLRMLKFLDPACGCGNFLVIAYRELRLLELEILRVTREKNRQMLEINTLIQLDVDQFYGIEIEEFPAQIAQVALWLMDHQMNLLVSEEFGLYFARIPLRTSSTIVCGNALRIDWNDLIPAERLSYIMGNPPFGGKQYQNAEQKADMSRIFSDVQGAGVLDYVAAWYRKASEYMANSPGIKTAFVSTNSITQGEQVSVLWPPMLKKGLKIHFAHHTFQWSNEARGKAAVHCIIVGFALHDCTSKTIFNYESTTSDAYVTGAKNINPYLIDAPDLVISKRRLPISNVPEMTYGSMPNDGGHLLLSAHEKKELVQKEPSANKWIRPFVMGEELINDIERWTLWLDGISPAVLSTLPEVLKRVEAVRVHRLASKRPTTKELALFPTRFGEVRQPSVDYIAVPRVSSENRRFIPIAILAENVIAGDKVYTIPNGKIYEFGVLMSTMHMAWMRTTCGRLKSDYSYSNSIVYNNFPWPENPNNKQKQAIENAAQAVLDARTQFPDSSLANLYDSLTMPPVLLKAHHTLDKAVDAAYGRTNFKTEAERVAFLFDLYEKFTAPLETVKAKKSASKSAGS